MLVYKTGSTLGSVVSRWVACALLAACSLFATTFSATALAATDEFAPQAAALINNIRAKLDNCSSNGMLGASASASSKIPIGAHGADPSRRSPLVWNTQLAKAALNHSQAMAKELFFDHNDMQGRAVNHRVGDQGYRFRVVGENIAAGQASLEEAIRDWLLSAGHCVNMIDERFTEFGIARVVSSRSDDPYGVYWTLVLGQPRDGQIARR